MFDELKVPTVAVLYFIYLLGFGKHVTLYM